MVAYETRQRLLLTKDKGNVEWFSYIELHQP